MKYREFLDRVREDLEEMLPDMEVSVREVEKLQGESYEGIYVKREGSSIGNSYDLRGYYEDIEAGADYNQVLAEMTKKIISAGEIGEMFKNSDLLDYGKVKSRLAVQLVGREGNEDMLQSIPHMDMEDLALVYRVDMSDVMGNNSSAVITNGMLKAYGITQEQLHEEAMAAAAERQPYSIRTMGEVLAEMSGFPEPEMEVNSLMYVVTTPSMYNGASAIAYPDFMEKAAEKLGGDFYILPSSIHEVILLPDNVIEDKSGLKEMVSEVNDTQLRPNEVLSSNVYHYDSRGKVFEIAEKFEERKSEREKERPSALKTLEANKDKVGRQPHKTDKAVSKEDPALSI